MVQPRPEEIGYGALPCFTAMLRSKVEERGGLDFYDSIIAWSGPIDELYLEPILSHADASSLLDMISQDNAGFLKCFTKIYPITIDAVLFILGRYFVLQNNASSDESVDDPVALSLGQIIWKYFLIAPPHHYYIIEVTISDILTTARPAYGWSYPAYRDIEDSRATISAFIGCFSPLTPRRRTRPLHSATFVSLQKFIMTFLQPGIEDLIPFMFRSIITELWSSMRSNFESNNADWFIENVTVTFGTLTFLLDQCDSSNGNPCPPILVQITEEIASNDLLDLIQCVFFILKCPKAQLGQPTSKSTKLIEAIYSLARKLAQKVPKKALSSVFMGYALDWFKCERHMAYYFDSANIHPDVQITYHHQLVAVWRHVAAILEQDNNIYRERWMTVACNYSRCPAPGKRGDLGSQLSCFNCSETGYCSHRCQAADWAHYFGRAPHRELCRGYVKPITAGEIALEVILRDKRFTNLDLNYVQPVYEKHNGDLSKVIPELVELAKLPQPVLV